MPKVMLIEDDATMNSLLSMLLQMEGFEVAQLEDEDNLEDILEVVRLADPALALIDIHLKQLSGLELLHAIRQTAELDSMRVLMSSGMDFRDECLQAGADNFVLKPYMPDDLVDTIRQLLEPDS
jgi:DNA-binding response OmpR family regulator